MDFQALMDTISEAARTTRKDYHLTLDKLIKVIEDLEDRNITVVLDYNRELGVGLPESYRGYYADLSLPQARVPATADKLLVMLKSAYGSTFEGYKGGDFEMDGDTPLWIAANGETGRALIDTTVDQGRLVLVTKDLN